MTTLNNIDDFLRSVREDEGVRAVLWSRWTPIRVSDQLVKAFTSLTQPGAAPA